MINKCIICYEKIKNKNLVILDCGHKYDEFCINKWLDIKNNCPYCRKPVYIKEENYNYKPTIFLIIMLLIYVIVIMFLVY